MRPSRLRGGSLSRPVTQLPLSACAVLMSSLTSRAVLVMALPCSCRTAAGAADFALNTADSSADQYAVGVKYHFSPFVSWYMVGSYLRNGPGAHYCLGVSGHGY